MEFQTLIVVAIVLAAVVYMGLRLGRTLRSAKVDAAGTCGSGCGCEGRAHDRSARTAAGRKAAGKGATGKGRQG